MPGLSLQPFIVLKSEVTEVNQMYWLHRYTTSRTVGILGAIAAIGYADNDPAVSQIWPSTVDGENSSLTKPLSQLATQLDMAGGRIRATSVLYLCSAFERYLVNLYALAALYRPHTVYSPTYWSWGPVPQVLSMPEKYRALKRRAVTMAKKELCGKYSGRIATLLRTFNCSSIGSLGIPSTLDSWYAMRHRIAHQQGLLDPAEPDASGSQILRQRVRVSEEDWKKMIGDFFKSAELLNDEARDSVVSDGGMAIALWKELAIAPHVSFGEISLAKVRLRLAKEWGIRKKTAQLAVACQSLGYTVRPSKRGGLLAKPVVAGSTQHAAD